MRLLTFFVISMMSTLAIAAESDETGNKLAEKIHKVFPRIAIDGVRQSSVRGLYELQSGKSVFYSDENGDHVIFGGQIIETSTQRNLTQERVEELSKIDWNILPLDKAIVSGDENAKLKLAVFTDPECPYCKQLESELQHAKGIKVYSFLLPLSQIHPEARAKAEAIWCSSDQHKAMLNTILKGVTPKTKKCDTPLDDIADLAKKIGIVGTPALIAGDGRVYPGVKNSADLTAWLSKK